MSSPDSQPWSFEPHQLVVSVAGRERDLHVDPNHEILRGRGTLRRGSVLTSSRLNAAAAGATRRPDHRGRVTVIRRPVSQNPGQAVLDAELALGPELREVIAIPWATIVPSLIGGAVVAYFFSPLFAVLAGVTAVGLLARSIASRLGRRRDKKKRTAAVDLAIEELVLAKRKWALHESERLRDATVALGSITTPWSWRVEQNEALRLELGAGPLQVVPPFGACLASLVGNEAKLDEELGRPVQLVDIPLGVELEAGLALAVVGERCLSLGLVRQLCLGVLTKVGPADLQMVVLTTADRLVDWDWAKWLPSLLGVAVTSAEVEDLLGFDLGLDLGIEAEGDSQLLVVVDGPEPAGPGSFATLFSGRSERVRMVWIGCAGDAPAACVSRATVFGDGTLLLEDLVDASQPSLRGVSQRCSLARAVEVARELAPLSDPELEDTGGDLADSIGHETVHSPWLAGGGGWARALSDCWPASDRTRLVSRFALGASGPVDVDLVADGPHALVAGTTGSGKSEMLRSLVVGLAVQQPPEHVSFVLVDFKGGGAFDLVADLPHVAGIVTDLDQAESSRAMRSLQAELRSREELFRTYGVSDIAELEQEVLLPRLVIVVDEFASLAEELPEFLDGLIDVARRGRSLGVHLVLATQRPAGVVTGQIRSNTNLKVCLRVQDQSDSMDVLGHASAAALPAIPGRAIIDRGGHKPLTVQCVRVQPSSGDGMRPFVVHPALLERTSADSSDAGSSDVDPADVAEGSPDDPLAELVVAARAVSAFENQAPWMRPLLSAGFAEVCAELGSLVQSAAAPVPVGWLDDPDHRRRVPLGWNPDAGGLAIVGSDRTEVEATVHSVLHGLAHRCAERQMYVLDGSGGELAGLESIGQVGSVVGVGEPERCAKVVAVLAKRLRDRSDDAKLVLVVHCWGSVVDAIESVSGPGAGGGLARLLRDGVSGGLAVVLTGATDRDIPGRVLSSIDTRIVHRLADPTGYLSLGIRCPSSAPVRLAGSGFIEPGSGLRGVAIRLAGESLRSPSVSAPSIEVLGEMVHRSLLPAVAPVKHGDPGPRLVPVGLTEDLDPANLRLGPGSKVLIVGQPGSGRSTALETVASGLSGLAGDPQVRLVDDAEAMNAEQGQRLLAEVADTREALVVATTPGSLRGIGGWLGPLLAEATVVLLNPSRSDGEACRTIVPDLTNAAPGRAVLLDRGRSTIIQVAA